MKKENALYKCIGKLFGSQGSLQLLARILMGFVLSAMATAKFYETAYDAPVKITEFFTGTSVFKNYYKPADFMMPRRFLLYFLLAFLVVTILHNLMKLFSKDFTVWHYLLLGQALILASKKYFGMLVGTDCILFGVLSIPAIVHLILCHTKAREVAKERLDAAISMMVHLYFALFTVVTICLSFHLFGNQKLRLGMAILMGIGTIGAIAMMFTKNRKLVELCVTALQAIMVGFPLSFLSFSYLADGSFVRKSFAKLSVFGILLALVMVFFFVKEKKSGKKLLTTTSLCSMAMMQLSYQVFIDLFDNVNLFHYGELIVPAQQMFEFGKLPYFQFFPIHGLCDYFFQTINVFLLDGSYGAFSLAYYVGSVLLCALVAFVISICVEDDTQKLIYVGLFMVVGEWYYYFRFILVLPILVLFFCRKIRGSVYASTICYVLSCIVAIAWYPAIGGAIGISLLPILLWRLVRREYRQQYSNIFGAESRKRYLLGCVPVLALGLAFVPMFLGIVRYLKENMGISDYFPGDKLTNLIISSPPIRFFEYPNFWNDVVYLCFLFVVPIMILVFCSFGKQTKSYFQEGLVTVCLFSYVIVSYTFGSITAVERGLIVDMVLFLFVAFLLGEAYREEMAAEKKAIEQEKTKKDSIAHEKQTFPENGISAKREEKNMKSAAWLVGGMGIILAFTYAINSTSVIDLQKQALSYQEIPEQFHRADGAELGYGKMGEVYLTDENRQIFTEIAYVVNNLCQDGDTYLDFTNQAALYQMLGKETPFSYCALYHGTSAACQESMLKEIQAKTPKLVLVAPRWENEGGSVSLKNKDIYEYIVSLGYEPYAYGNVCFMLSPDVPVPDWAENGAALYIRAMMTEQLQGLPSTWADSEAATELSTIPADFQQLSLQNAVRQEGTDTYLATGQVPGMAFVCTQAEAVSKAEYLKIHFASDLLDEKLDEPVRARLYFSYKDDDYSTNNSVLLEVRNGEMLVPLYAWPLWTKYGFEVLKFEIDCPALEGREFDVSYELLYDEKSGN